MFSSVYLWSLIWGKFLFSNREILVEAGTPIAMGMDFHVTSLIRITDITTTISLTTTMAAEMTTTTGTVETSATTDAVGVTTTGEAVTTDPGITGTTTGMVMATETTIITGIIVDSTEVEGRIVQNGGIKNTYSDYELNAHTHKKDTLPCTLW